MRYQEYVGVSGMVSANVAFVDGAQVGYRMQDPALVLVNETGAPDVL